MNKRNYLFIILLAFSLASLRLPAQGTAKNDLLLSAGYYNSNNQLQYLAAHAKTKINGKFQMVPGIPVSFYINNDSSAANLLGKATTNEKGNAILFIPAAAKEQWNKSSKQNFVVVSKATALYDENKTTVPVTKAKLLIDTTDGRKITVTAMELNDTGWVPVKGVELKMAVKRLGADLNVNETPTYTTDSTGTVSADYKRDSLPGDAKGMLTLVARVEDNDTYGNLTAERIVPWGSVYPYLNEFDKRTLFARRGRSPIWLQLFAYSIIVAVWGIIIYLVFQIKKIKMLGV
jgi:hypothetical protein